MIILEIKFTFIYTYCFQFDFLWFNKRQKCIKFINRFSLNIFIISILLYTYYIILFVYNNDSKVIFI